MDSAESYSHISRGMSLPCSGYDILPTILLTFSLKVMNFFISHVALMMRNVLVTLFFTSFSPLEPPKSIGWLVRWSNSEGSEFVDFAGIKLVSLTAGILTLFSRTRWKSTKSYHDSRCDQNTTQIYFILHESNTIYTHFVHSSPHSIFGYLNKIFWSLKRIVLIGWMHRLMSKV